MPKKKGFQLGQTHFEPLTSETTEFAEFQAVCPAIGVNLPEADPGHLCVYTNRNNFEPQALVNADFVGFDRPNGVFEEVSIGVSRAGGMMNFTFSGSAGEPAQGFGSWAVTGCGAGFPCPGP